jgi:hypothetical protein
MAIDLAIDAEALVKRLQDMRNRIGHFKRVDIGAELSAWQIRDLHRHRPFTMRWRAQGRAQTKIRPHSLYEMVRSEGATLPVKQQRRLVRGLRSQLGHPLGRGFMKTLREHSHWSTRPILRQEMEHVLMQHLQECMKEKLHW